MTCSYCGGTRRNPDSHGYPCPECNLEEAEEAWAGPTAEERIAAALEEIAELMQRAYERRYGNA